MPLPEEATLYIRIWTQQTCKACGTDFRYLRRFTVPRSQTEPNATQASVEAAYVQAAEKTAEVVVPCPHCGYIQPDMAGTRKAVRHGVLTFAAFILLLVNTITAAFDYLPHAVAAFIAAGLAVAALLVHSSIMAADPNRNRLANLGRAQLLIQKGLLRPVKTGGDASIPDIPRAATSYQLAIGLVVAALAVFVAPALADAPFWLCEVAGLILFVWAGSTFANAGLAIKEYSTPRKVVEVNTSQVLDDSVPEDFQKK